MKELGTLLMTRRPDRTSFARLLLGTLLGLPAAALGEQHEGAPGAKEFCLQGEFNLAARLQGLDPEEDSFYPVRFCVTTAPDTPNVLFVGSGYSNPDMQGRFAVRYEPPGRVRIVGEDGEGDTLFEGADSAAEARRNRRIDPRRLLQEINDNPGWVAADQEDDWLQLRYPEESTPIRARIDDQRLLTLETWADLPLRGRVPVRWNWRWPEAGESGVELQWEVDGHVMLRARGSWRAANRASLLEDRSTPQSRVVPGENWPARVAMASEQLAPGTWWIRGVRTGFNHLVVETRTGLVVADAPAGWVELQQIPPADLVPGLGISGLSERFVDYLAEAFPETPVRAVVLTHAHDDHAGGARAFAAAGAAIYAPARVAGFLERSLNRPAMPPDRLSASGRDVRVLPVEGRLLLEDPVRPVELIAIGPGPHVNSALGVWVPSTGFFFQSDLLVPRSEAPEPRADRAATECWFARWAAGALPADATVLNSHSAVRLPTSLLRAYLESAPCAERGTG